MPARSVANIRNIALVGHSAAGKTSLGEALLHKAGVTSRLGSVDEGTSVLDRDDESKERRQSTAASAFYVQHGDTLINVLDTPGAFDYSGMALAALSAADTAILVISAASGIGVNTRRMFAAAGEMGLARMIVVTRIDAESADLPELLTAIRDTFGHECLPINLPTGGGKGVVDLLTKDAGATDFLDAAHCHTELLDAIAESDEALMESYMETGTIPAEKLGGAISKAIASGHVVPVLFVNSRQEVGVTEFLDAVVTFCPSPLNAKKRTLTVGEGDAATTSEVEPDEKGDFVAQVVKIESDPKSNIKYSVARVYRGTIGADGQIFMTGDRKGQRVGHLMKPRGDKYEEIPSAHAGDLISFAKLELHIGATLFDKPTEGRLPVPKFPTPMASVAVEPKARGDVEKISVALHRFAEEDPCFKYERDPETHELVMQGLGDQHLTVLRSKLKRYYKIEVDTKPPKIPYRETISGSVKYVEYTHKKQTGGAGQFARVFIDMEPNERGKGYEFVDKIFGGAIDGPFRPSVDKGIRDQIRKGVVAGYPVVDVKVSLVDGKTHPVDSKDIAFQIAGRQVFKKAFVQCKPILLEPVVNIEVTAPTANVGDITRDLAGKRGQIIGQDMLPGGQICVRAVVPLAEVAGYSSQLNSVTGGQGSFLMEFSHYDIVPPNVQQQIVAAHKPKDEEE